MIIFVGGIKSLKYLIFCIFMLKRAYLIYHSNRKVRYCSCSEQKWHLYVAFDKMTKGEIACSLKVVMALTEFFLFSTDHAFSLILLWEYFNLTFKILKIVCIENKSRSMEILRIYATVTIMHSDI